MLIDFTPWKSAFKEYVLIAQDKYHAEHFIRQLITPGGFQKRIDWKTSWN